MINALFLTIVLFLGLITTYEDVKFGLVRNKWLLLGLGFGAGFYLVLFIQHQFPGSGRMFFINVFISFCICLLLWKLNYWPAGDAKLFFVFSFLIPEKYYHSGAIKYFPSYVLLINIFVPMFVVIMLRAVYGVMESGFHPYGWISAVITRLRNNVLPHWKKHLSIFSGFMLMFMTLQLSVKPLEKYIANAGLINLLKMILYFVFFAAYQPVISFLSAKDAAVKMIKTFAVFTFVYMSYVLVTMQNANAFFSEMYKVTGQSLMYMIAVAMVYKIIFLYSEKMDVVKIKVSDIKAGDILTEKSLETLKEKIDHIIFYSDGISADDREMIRTVMSDESQIEIYKTIPFAPIIFAGVIITLLIRTSVVHFSLSALR